MRFLLIVKMWFYKCDQTVKIKHAFEEIGLIHSLRELFSTGDADGSWFSYVILTSPTFPT